MCNVFGDCVDSGRISVLLVVVGDDLVFGVCLMMMCVLLFDMLKFVMLVWCGVLVVG